MDCPKHDKDSYDNLVNQYKSTIEPFKINLPKYLSFKNKQFRDLFEYYQNLVIYPGSTKGAIKEKLIFKDNILSFGLGGQDAARDIIKKFREQIENKEK